MAGIASAGQVAEQAPQPVQAAASIRGRNGAPIRGSIAIACSGQASRQLMQAILFDKVKIADAVQATPITLDEAPKGYADFDAGAPKKYVLNPNGYVK